MKVYLSEYIHPAAERLLREHADVVDSFEEIEHINAMIIRVAAVNRKTIAQAKALKIIAKHGVGCNTIDLEAAKEFGVPVLNTPFANTNSVAELIVGLALSLCRQIPYADVGCRRGAFAKVPPAEFEGMELSGKTLGLVGMGNIAVRAAEILRMGFGMRVIGYDPYVDAVAAGKMCIEKVEALKDLLAQADVVSVSVPLTDTTKNMISGDLFDAFRENAILINTARGGVVNEQDLYHALTSRKLKAAACDVFTEEPPATTHPLLTLPNFCVTPHIGAVTEEALYRTGMEVVSEVLSVLSGNQPKHRVV